MWQPVDFNMVLIFRDTVEGKYTKSYFSLLKETVPNMCSINCNAEFRIRGYGKLMN